jgi:hypothetical protein
MPDRQTRRDSAMYIPPLKFAGSGQYGLGKQRLDPGILLMNKNQSWSVLDSSEQKQ